MTIVFLFVKNCKSLEYVLYTLIVLPYYQIGEDTTRPFGVGKKRSSFTYRLKQGTSMIPKRLVDINTFQKISHVHRRTFEFRPLKDQISSRVTRLNLCT